MSNLMTDSCVNILGVKVHATSMDRALATIESAIANGDKGYVCVTGVQGVMEAQVDSNLKRIINHSVLTTPDGRPTVWVGWLRGFFNMRQVTGPDMMLRICALSAEKGYTHFFYGGNAGVADQLKDSLTKRFPGMKVVGTYTPPFRPLYAEEEAELIRMVFETKPDFFWVGLSTPKQERFMDQYISKLDTKLMFGVGAVGQLLRLLRQQALGTLILELLLDLVLHLIEGRGLRRLDLLHLIDSVTHGGCRDCRRSVFLCSK